MTADDAMTAIVSADTDEAAAQYMAGLPPRILRDLADQMHVDTGGKRPALTARIVKEARA
jgi:hypothetical protein